MPWITRTRTAGPEWRHVDQARIFACQTGWLCQSCGLLAPRSALVIVNPDHEVLSNAPLCRPCLAAAMRWCPGLHRADDIAVVPVTPGLILADSVPLLERWQDYGDESRSWKTTTS